MTFMKPEQKKWIRWILRLMFLGYLFVLLYLMFLSERYGRVWGSGGYHYNLRPFQEIRRYLQYREQMDPESFFINIYGNVLAFMPFGCLAPIISRKRPHFLLVLLWSVALTLTIETTQLLLQVGCFDVDDMILNVIGGVLGYVSYRVLYGIIRKVGSRWHWEK